MLVPSTVQRNASTADVVDRLFQKFSAMYGRHWLEMWANIPLETVKPEWQRQLEAVPMQAMRAAVLHLERNNKFPPTLPEFRALCDQFRPAEVPQQLTAEDRRVEMPDTVRAEIEDIRQREATARLEAPGALAFSGTHVPVDVLMKHLIASQAERSNGLPPDRTKGKP